MERALVVLEPTRGRFSVEGEEPTPLNSFHLKVSDWVIRKAIEINYCVGMTCEGFEDEFLALLTAIEAGGAQSKVVSSL